VRKEDRYDSLIKYYADENLLDWLKVKAQIKQESAFDPDAKSSVGALGLMQFMPPTWKEWYDGTPGLQVVVQQLKLVDPRDPEDAISAGCRYNRWLLRYFKQDERKALAAYNWGCGNVRRVEAEFGDAWISHLPRETADYLVKINRNYVDYQHELLQKRPT
jgi:soluble lytic murein transglycosylase-like protein